MTAGGNCTDSSDPCGGSVSAVYPAKGNLRNRPVSVTTPDGGTWEFGYDRSGNLVSRTNPEGAVTRMTYRNGAVASVKDPYGVVTSSPMTVSITSRKPPIAGGTPRCTATTCWAGA